MSNKTRKHIWSGASVMSIAMVGVLAAFLVLTGSSGITEAHEPPAGQTHAQDCADMSPANRGIHDAFARTGAVKCSDTTGTVTVTPPPMPGIGTDGSLLKSSSDHRQRWCQAHPHRPTDREPQLRQLGGTLPGG